MNTQFPQHLIGLRQIFVQHGFDIRFVGGFVRDTLLGIVPKDIDLCTNATPDEQIRVYRSAGVHFVETGIAHGTITAVLPEGSFEITSLRTETNHDGRHADVAFTHDWIEDLSRRDLTINAMSMTFDGEFIDPFGGQADLQAGTVRFVNDPNERMREDFLRILRWLRFHARISPEQPLDPETARAATAQAVGLCGISRERVWAEVSKMLTMPGGVAGLRAMFDLGLAEHCGLPVGDLKAVHRLHRHNRNPVTLIAAFVRDPKAMRSLKDAWKWSNEEANLAMFVTSNIDNHTSVFHLVAHDGAPIEFAIELAHARREPETAAFLRNWKVPVFPVTGQDLLDRGFKQGQELGKKLRSLKQQWADSQFTMTHEQLMNKAEG